MTLADEFRRILADTVRETGRSIQDLDAVRNYAQSRMIFLASIVDQPGFELALRAERDSVALRAGIAVVEAADAVDQRIIGIITGALGIGARALAGG